ncbi:MAG TPA: hypothetical protein PKV35_01160, partial [bacterium]|nr:hypothetical protein [bacterium]
MRNFFSMVTVVLMMFCYFSIQAVDLRIVLLPKMTVDGKEYDSASIETEMASILTGKNMRIVELSTALKAQKAALSDLVAEGKVPTELSVLNADALVSA